MLKIITATALALFPALALAADGVNTGVPMSVADQAAAIGCLRAAWSSQVVGGGTSPSCQAGLPFIGAEAKNGMVVVLLRRAETGSGAAAIAGVLRGDNSFAWVPAADVKPIKRTASR